MPAGKTYEPINRATVTNTSTTTITFSSIPSTYTDLVLVLFGGIDPSAAEFSLRMNGDTGNTYSTTRLRGNGSTLATDRQANIDYIHIGSPGNSLAVGNSIVNIFNYANTTTFKSVIARSNNTTRDIIQTAGVWRNTSAITSLSVQAGPIFTNGSTLALYGITAA